MRWSGSGSWPPPKREAGPGWNDWLAALARERRVTRLHLPRATLWVAAERLPQFQTLWPQARLEPRDRRPGRSCRARLVGGGRAGRDPARPPRGPGAGHGRRCSRRRSGSSPATSAAALAALEVEGFALRGRFTPAAAAEEWCERRLLARIHRYTVKRLRAEIEPVAARDFLRFLFGWQHVAADARMQGPDALEVVVAQLEGFEAPAGAWETEILPARLADYEPSWLDDQCLAGRITWARLRPRIARPNGGERAAAPVRTTPITLLARRHAPLWASFSTVAGCGSL